MLTTKFQGALSVSRRVTELIGFGASCGVQHLKYETLSSASNLEINLICITVISCQGDISEYFSFDHQRYNFI